MRRDRRRTRARRSRWSTPRPRSLWPCQSMPTSAPIAVDEVAREPDAGCVMPSGVAWPTVSQRQRRVRAVLDRVAEQRRQHLGPRARRVLGDVGDRAARSCTAKSIASAELLEHAARGPSPRRTGGSASEPMNAITSIGMPSFCEISTIGLDVVDDGARAQAALMLQLGVADLARRARDVLDCARRPAPGRPMSTWSMPRSFIRCRSLSLSSIFGIDHRRALHAVAQRLVEERDLVLEQRAAPLERVPVVDDVGLGQLRGRLAEHAVVVDCRSLA